MKFIGTLFGNTTNTMFAMFAPPDNSTPIGYIAGLLALQ